MTPEEILVKSIISALAVLLTAGLLLIQAGCTEAEKAPAAENPAITAPVPAGAVRGAVLETMDSGGYTYVSIEANQGPIWVAGPQTSVSIGDVVEVSQGMAMQQFSSKTLNRTFDVLYFVNAIVNLTTPSQASSGKPAAEDPRVRRRIAEYETRIAAMRFNGLRYLTKQIRGEPLGSETSVNKLHTAHIEKYTAEFALELQGSYGAIGPGGEHPIDHGRWQKEALGWCTAVIGGGTPNIQKNIIAERILGLPHD